MKKIINRFEHIFIATHLVKWTIITIPVAFVTGSMVALFLWLLDLVTFTRYANEWLIWFLPAAGVLIYFIYKFSWKNAEAGNNLIMDEIHAPGGGVPARMAPLVLATTIITHLFGGSAGREGTAVQIGGSMAGLLGKWFKLNKEDIKIILMTGLAAGFGAVFGTPLAGAIFALEVLYVGRISHNALLPCLIAAILADITCTAWGITHTHYAIALPQVIESATSLLHVDYLLLLKVVVAGVCFGLTGYVFSELSHSIKNYSKRLVTPAWVLPAIGGVLIIALTYILGTTEYLGLGVVHPDPNVTTIVSAFHAGGADGFSWAWKILFTAITLGMGFKGGEVTPLFFIGATLGNTLAMISGAPVDLMAGLGFIAVFAGATNTPIACTLMGVELFGGEYTIYYAVACFTAYYFSGHTGIYHSQRVAVSKSGQQPQQSGQSLMEIRNNRTRFWKFWTKK